MTEGVLDDAADVILGGVAQVSVAVGIVEQVLAVFPQALVAVHTAAVIAEHGFRHEGQGFSMSYRSILENVLVELELISHLHQWTVFQVDLHLTAGRNFSVMDLDINPSCNHAQDSL